MTLVDFDAFVKRINLLWNAEFDVDKIKAWHHVLGRLKIERLLLALDELAFTTKFTPKIAEIVEMYDVIKLRQARAEREKQTKLLSTADDMSKCFICRNDGVVIVLQKNYMTSERYTCLLRCSCGHGKDLNRWSRPQITKSMKALNPVTKVEESIYIPDVDDYLTHEEIVIIKAKNVSRIADNCNNSHEIIEKLKSLTWGRMFTG